MKWFVSLVLLVWCVGVSEAQEKPILPIFIAPDLDTNFIDLQRDKWSIRAFSSMKYHALFIRDENLGQTVRFTPNNVFAVGVGFAYRFWLIDVGFGISPNQDNGTESFDLQTSIILGSRHLFSFGLQWYRGFQTRGLETNPFRDDLRVAYGGIDYAYYFNYRKLSMRAVFRGDLRQLKSSFSPILGAFLSADYVRSDSNLITRPDFVMEGQIVDAHTWVSGVQAGIAGSWVAVNNLILFGSFLPGVGFEWGNVEARGTSFQPRWRPASKINVQAAIMYTHPRFYLGLTGNGNFYFPNITSEIQYRYQVGKIKLLFGWRFFSRIELLEKANRILEKR